MIDFKQSHGNNGDSTTERKTAREGGRLTALPSRGVGISIAETPSRRCVVLGATGDHTTHSNDTRGDDE